MRIATYNVEWFDALFDDHGNLLADGEWSARHDVTRQAQIEALGIVFTAMDADAVMVIEAPDSHSRRSGVRALETFAETFQLRARKAIIGFTNNTQQEIALLYDPDTLSVRHDPQGDETGKKGDRTAPRFDSVFRIDLDIDSTEDLVQFSKPPLELACKTAGRFCLSHDRRASEIQGAPWVRVGATRSCARPSPTGASSWPRRSGCASVWSATWTRASPSWSWAI